MDQLTNERLKTLKLHLGEEVFALAISKFVVSNIFGCKQ